MKYLNRMINYYEERIKEDDKPYKDELHRVLNLLKTVKREVLQELKVISRTITETIQAPTQEEIMETLKGLKEIRNITSHTQAELTEYGWTLTYTYID